MAVMEVVENDFDLVLMDWNMPNLTGIEALRVIRSVGKKVPVIMVTTETDKDRIVEAIKAGANQYIFKPFKPKMLLNKIHQVIAEVPK